MRMMKNRSIKGKMLRSYLIVVVIAILINGILGAASLRTTWKRVQTAHRTELEKVTLQMDSVFQTVQHQAKKLANDPMVCQVLSMRGNPFYRGEDMIRVKDVMNSFCTTIETDAAVRALYLIDFRQKTIVSDRTIVHSPQYDETAAQLFNSSFNEESRSGFLTVRTEAGVSRYYCAEMIYTRSVLRPDGILVAEIDPAELTGRLATFEQEREFPLLVFEGGECLCLNEAAERIGNRYGSEDFAGTEIRSIRIDGRRYVYSAGNSSAAPVTYYYVTDSLQYYGWLHAGLITSAVYILAMVVIGVLLARKYTEENVLPLEQIMTLLRDPSQASDSLTYSGLTEAVSQVVRKAADYEGFLADHYSSFLLNGQLDAAEEGFPAEFRRFEDQQAPMRLFCAKILGSDAHEVELERFCMQNVWSELLGNRLIGRAVVAWDRIYFLLRGEGVPDEELIRNGIEALAGKLEIDGAYALSECVLSVKQLYEARRQTDTLVEYAAFSEELNFPVMIDDMMTDDTRYGDHFTKDLKKFMNSLTASEYETSIGIFNEIWKKDIRKNISDVKTSRNRMIALYSILSSAMKEDLPEMELPEVGEAVSLQELYDRELQILQMICEAAQTKKSDAREGMYERMRSYVLEHIAEQDLTASRVCEAFGVSASYVSNLFTKNSGEGILVFIHRERIERAKRLLKEGCSVQEVSQIIGFTDSRSFIRTFKKYEGMTPGQFKNEEQL